MSKIPTIGNSDTVGDAKLIRVVLPAKLNDVCGRIVPVFGRQAERRGPAKVVTNGEAPLTVELAVARRIGTEEKEQ